MVIRELAIPGVFEIVPKRFEDARGFFSETFASRYLSEAGLPAVWIQDNHSLSRDKFVLRGLHFQAPPMAQDKLVRVTRGSIFDVAVDIRHESPTFGKWVSLVVSSKLWNQILVPKGFAHGFLTLEEETEVAYKVTETYSSAHDRAIRWDDAEIAVDWPLKGASPSLSAKDEIAPLLQDVNTGFKFSEFLT
jgi:dTDP-4-dehydrorhamnose 3,5-epimerase